MLIEALADSTDQRGRGFSVIAGQLARVGDVRDVHITTINPGCMRGNHYHPSRRELIAVLYRDAWSLHWDTGAGTAVTHRSIQGVGGVLVGPPAGWSHAVRNDGGVELVLVALSDVAYDHAHPDVVRRDVISQRSAA